MTGAEVPAAAVIIIALVAVVYDVRTHRIPNWLTFGGAGAAVVYAAVVGGLAGSATSLGGWLIGAALFFPFFALGGMGAGDVKLVAALGAWLGPIEAVWLTIFAALAGGILAVVVSIAGGYLRTAVGNLWLMVMHWRTHGFGPVPGLTLKDSSSPRLAYAVPITIGVLCTLWRR